MPICKGQGQEKGQAVADDAVASGTARLEQDQIFRSVPGYRRRRVLTGPADRLGTLPALGLGITAGLLLPHWYVSFKRRRHFKRFTANLADAVDVVVRGVKVGLPLIECFKIVAREARESGQRGVPADHRGSVVGMPLADATERLPDRVPIAEARFFSIVIAIQNRSGGSLAEALGNLSKVLRDRQKMRR